jgi:hypothetical protein
MQGNGPPFGSFAVELHEEPYFGKRFLDTRRPERVNLAAGCNLYVVDFLVVKAAELTHPQRLPWLSTATPDVGWFSFPSPNELECLCARLSRLGAVEKEPTRRPNVWLS